MSLAIFGFFLIFLAGQIYCGWKEHNSEALEKGLAIKNLQEYLTSAHFIEAPFENWESEFLQMGMYVILTVFLKQQGSSESKKLTEENEVNREPVPHENAPWPVKKGGIALAIYKNSLSIAFLLLFLLSFVFHSVASLREYNQEEMVKGNQAVSYAEYLSHSRLWFESFQNWQSEFIAVFGIVVLSIFLRQKGSPESKPVDAPDSETGSS